MKLVTCMGLGAAGLSSFALAMGLGVQGCSSSSTTTPGGGDQTGTVQPARPSAATTTSTAEHNFALYSVALGDQSADAWKQYGYNIDGLISDSTAHLGCTPVTGATASKLVDGPGGIDNSFGQVIVKLITGLVSNLSGTVSDSLKNGHFTVMLDTKGLDDTTTQTAVGLTGKIFGGEHFNQAPNGTDANVVPKWDGTDVWPLNKDFLSNPADPTSAKITFANAYVVNGKFVNGDPTAVTLQMSIQGVALQIPVSHAIITFDHQGKDGANGIIAGVINTEQFIQNLKGVAGNISANLCSGSAFDQIATSIRVASDIMSDGTAGQGKTCDAISIGIGFTGKEIMPPSVTGTPGPSTPACQDSDAGAPDSGPTEQDAASE